MRKAPNWVAWLALIIGTTACIINYYQSIPQLQPITPIPHTTHTIHLFTDFTDFTSKDYHDKF